MKFLASVALLVCWCFNSQAQEGCEKDFQLSSEVEHKFGLAKQAMTVLEDQRNNAHLYVAGLEAGLRIFDSSNPSELKEVGSLDVSDFDDLAVTNLFQLDDRLYLSLGNHFTDKQNPGLAIVDISDPTNAKVLDVWKYEKTSSGGGVVMVEGNYAYLGAMGHGLIILSIENDKAVFESQFIPDIVFPNPKNPDPAKFNARGLDVDGNNVYLCYDAGGIRIIDVTSKQNPKEIGKYSLPALDKLPRAYNNLVFHNNKIFVAIDYCGLEILDVENPSDIKQLGWWNPWDCTSSTLAWFSSPGHTNEIAYLEKCEIVAMSAGKSEMVMVDVHDFSKPELCDSFGSVDSKQGTWGLTRKDNRLSLGYIYVPLGVPFLSNWSGIRQVEIGHDCATITSIDIPEGGAFWNVLPLGNGKARLEINGKPKHDLQTQANIFNLQGQLISTLRINANTSTIIEDLKPGIYTIRIANDSKKFVMH